MNAANTAATSSREGIDVVVIAFAANLIRQRIDTL
jgi:hypothetical protein